MELIFYYEKSVVERVTDRGGYIDIYIYRKNERKSV